MAGGNVRRDKCMLMVTLGLNVQHTHHPLCGIVEIVFAYDKILPPATEPTNSNKTMFNSCGKVHGVTFPFFSFCRINGLLWFCRMGAAIIGFFYSCFCFLILHFILLSPCNCSIIQLKKFVNVPKSKQFMNEWVILCYMALYAVISRYSVLSHARNFLFARPPAPVNGQDKRQSRH